MGYGRVVKMEVRGVKVGTEQVGFCGKELGSVPL
jgi:hypothetical protein